MFYIAAAITAIIAGPLLSCCTGRGALWWLAGYFLVGIPSALAVALMLFMMFAT